MAVLTATPGRHRLAQPSRLVSWWALRGGRLVALAKNACDGVACASLPVAIVVLAVMTGGAA